MLDRIFASLGIRPETPGDDPTAALFLTPAAAEGAAKTYIRRKRLPLDTPYRTYPAHSRHGVHKGWRVVVAPRDGARPYALTTYQTA